MTNEEKFEITDSEWEVMRVVWTRTKATSKEIINVLQDKKDWKPATTKTFIGRLVKKGALNTETVGNKFIYTAAVTEEESLKSLKAGLFNHICNTAVGKTIADLIKEATLSHDDIAMIEEILKSKKKDAVDVIVCNCVPGQCHCKENHNMNCH
ncbi:CopY/TcrY family copper transport repressor [Mesobacillus subterraneus]|uniref:CopY/TcrY family copper transport repressor n=1 Tax=Mesobacillus subterraneus TaxID=285983 RepID=UPI00203FC8B5|nr:CopY/TcrY family copper transport repressor [Mesobacillus subterraneus]MCM3667146.1 CopY/TcrY family copper transport repressor [Mesobacillus subterraneus]MCM3685987.1 CopY/TcrY family copper transport repressor [Mesobacillus subterraneus]